MIMIGQTQSLKYCVIYLGLTLLLSVDLSTEKCLQDIPDFESKKNFVVDGVVQPLVLGGGSQSWRPSQAFTNNVLKILIEEVMGYGGVSIATDETKTFSTSQAVSSIAGCSDASCSTHVARNAASPSINPQVWLDNPLSLQPWMNTKEILDLGPIGLQARLGWYVSSSLVNTLWVREGLVVDHWRVLEGSQLTPYLTMSTREAEALTVKPPPSGSRRKAKGGRYCDWEGCTNGMYYPPWCQNTSKCVILLADYPEANFESLTSQISSLGLMVGVAWIGPNLKTTVRQRQEKGQPSLYFSWTPNDITSSGPYSRMAFPSCQEQAGTDQTPSGDIGGCDFPWQNVNKVIWRPLVTGAPYVYDLIKDIRFSNAKMDSILYNYFYSRLSMEAFACEWVIRNGGTWEPWIPSGTTSIRRTILLGGLFESIMDSSSPYAGVEPGARMAVDAINADTNILQSYKLELAAVETGCSREEALLSYFRFYEDRGQSLAGLVGPMCSREAEVVGSISKFLNTVVISYRSDSPSLADKQQYPFYFRLFPDTTEESYAMSKLFRHFGWGRYGLLASNDDVTTDIITDLQEVMGGAGIEPAMITRIDEDEMGREMAESYVSDIVARNTRLIIGHFSEKVARLLLCEAFRQGVTGTQGYQWFLPDWYQDGWWDTDYQNKASSSSSYQHSISSQSSSNVSCSTAEMVKAIRGYISLSRAFIANWDKPVPGGLTVEGWIDQYNSVIEKEGKMPTTYAAYAYDTVWTYAYALDKLLLNDASALDTISSPQTVGSYMRHLSNTSFSGVTGDVQFLDQDRRGPVSIHQHSPPTTTIVGTYIPDMSTEDEGSLTLNATGIVWASGSQPVDGSNGGTCMVEGLRQALGSDCRTAIALMNTILLLVILVSTILLAVFIKRRYDRKVKRSEQHIKRLTLMGLGEDSLLTLDEWEMPRENVVLNRKLGEGAFGTVYGGEALLGNCKWAAVAVKTLKLGASVEEKLDFLSEAEMMKRFSHRNVVALLGVCTNGEPMYAVMEFMLYGDLKTFLLGRRHLVGERVVDQDHCMGPQRLTSMVMDVASGLSYLASINYVHRDLACRNCLVDATYTVKIGDFGMTRALYDSDYYRLGKRSKLPVRWMAPESLTEGIFTTMSDVWSLGVVIYEVVTFGNFPYQDLSNAEVLDYIRNENSLRPPDGCSTALGALMMHCWAIQPNRRPTAKDVTDILRQRPTLISPCLGAPLGSIPPEDLNSTGLPRAPSRKHLLAYKHSTRSNSSMDVRMGRDTHHDEEFLTGHLASVGHLFRASKRRRSSNRRHQFPVAQSSFELHPSTSGGVGGDDGNCNSLTSSLSDSAPSTSMSSTSSPSTSRDSCAVAIEDTPPPVIHRGRAKTATAEHSFLHRIPSGAATFSRLLRKAATQDSIFVESREHWSLFSSIESERCDGQPLIQTLPTGLRRGSRRSHSKRPRSKSLGSKSSSGSKSPSSKHSLYVTLSRNGFDDSKEEETMITFVSN